MVSRNLERANENDGFKMTALECQLYDDVTTSSQSWHTYLTKDPVVKQNLSEPWVKFQSFQQFSSAYLLALKRAVDVSLETWHNENLTAIGHHGMTLHLICMTLTTNPQTVTIFEITPSPKPPKYSPFCTALTRVYQTEYLPKGFLYA